MKETKYVLCDCCGSKIYLGSEVYCFGGYCGVYCSAECYADVYAMVTVLDEYEADNCGCDILDDDVIEKEKAEIEKEISTLQEKLDRLNKLTGHQTEKGGVRE